jgi:putative hydroxymethylpyrimidine transport system substrate-binding protein
MYRSTRVLRSAIRRPRSRALRLVAAVLLLACVAIPTAGARSAASTHKVTVWLDWYPNSDHAGIYVAIAKGYYAAAGLAVKPQVPSGAADVVKLVAHGSGDIGISYEPTVLLSRRQGIPVIATAAIVQRPLNAVLALGSTGITRPRQLEGHTVGVAGEPSDYTDLKALLQHDHGNYAKVRIVNVGYNLLPALLSHRVDAIIGAYWTWEALQAQAAGKPVNVLRLDSLGVPTYNELVFVTGKSQLISESTVLRAFQKATFQGYAYAAAHPAEATAILLKVPGVLSKSRGLIEHSINLLAPLFKDSQGRYGYMDQRRWQAYADWMTAAHLIQGHLDTSQALTEQLVP